VAIYHNLIEDVLEMEYDSLKESLECCTCEQCHNDIIAYALNHTAPRYVVNQSGKAISKIEAFRLQSLTDLRGTLVRAAMVVHENPRHEW